ncbi:unnamed protein product [Aphanomyces euteiches]|uniref:Glycine zipper domain-containing protein n=1 Tax=Aphanomyces euteiches TaxID=100861 RepID=A0A6G0WEI2_9STRA|nr:hypothetical protein Ae201684_016561 [Aphanomyces euteiches]KAH9084227.1 hypothetical protein Ae201684P_020477 [Aphanomyces euteiches]KAH9142178.1 hypothetical protein AeRB84_013733 [Aphanomyces euteiches]
MGPFETKRRYVGGAVGKKLGGVAGGKAGSLAGNSLGSAVAGPVGSKIGSNTGKSLGTTAGAAGGQHVGTWAGGKIGHGIDKMEAQAQSKNPPAPNAPKRSQSMKHDAQSPTSPMKRAPSLKRGHYETEGRQIGGTVGKTAGGAFGGAAGAIAGANIGSTVAGPVGTAVGTAAGSTIRKKAGEKGGQAARTWVGGKIGHGMDKAEARHNAKVRTSGKALATSNSLSSNGGSSYFMGIPPFLTS